MGLLQPPFMKSGGAVTYRYFRLFVVDNNGNANDLRVALLKITAGGTDYPTQNMTSNTAPSPLVASASSQDQANKEAWNAFGTPLDDTNSWQSESQNVTNQWLKIDLGPGNGIAPSGFKLTASGTMAPKNFRLEGDDTGNFSGGETVLKTVGPETGWGPLEERTFTI